MTKNHRLEEIRANMGLTQSEMCARMGIPLRTYTRYASGERPPSVEALEALARMDIDLHWLITGQGNMYRTAAPAHPPSSLDEDLMGQIAEAVAQPQAFGVLPPREQGRLIARLYNEIALAGLRSREEVTGAVRLAAVQFRHR
ncbi:helix-turn-helix protein [mine drainage metagenome]|uniref:Helix-turn-helix protein n=1 Tax=mine drainage metagenome TaxID=410659 RepID=A0A1J5RFY5_9ZZZZ